MCKCCVASTLLIVLLLGAAASGQTVSSPVPACELEAQRLCTNHRTIVSIEGTVISEEGTAIPNSIVILRGSDKGDDPPFPFTTVSDALGHFVFLALAEGKYELQIYHEGFKTLTKVVLVAANSTTDLAKLPLRAAAGYIQSQSGPPERIYFVTDRQPISCNKGPCFANVRAQNGKMSFGLADVNIPATSEGPEFILGGKTIDGETIDTFLQDAKSQGSEALVFIHGFDNSLDSAILELAALAHDTQFKGPVFLFSWASKDEFGSYFEDESTIDWSTPHFRRFLRDLNRQGFQRVDFMAHSMGSRLLLRGLESWLFTRTPAQAIFAAPDVDAETFQEAVITLKSVSPRVTMYASQRDQALLLSTALHGLGRAGLLLPASIMKGIDTIDVTNVDPTFLHHSYLVASTPLERDISELLLDKKSAFHRVDLNKMGNAPNIYWTLK